VAPNLVDPIVVDPNIMDGNLLHFITLVRSALSKVRTTTSGTSNCSVRGSSRAVKVNTIVDSRQQYHCEHSLSYCSKLLSGQTQAPAALSPAQ
jgi:hypothetical protein